VAPRTLRVNWEADLQGWLAPFLAALPRAEPRRWAPVYLEGLLSPAERKSVEPMAAHVCPGDVQQLHHFVSAAPWAPAPLEAVLARVADRLVGGRDAVLIIDDTALPKQGTHSVGVARQYCGALGKTANCQVLVSLTLARGEVPVPVALQLYLPQAWADDPARRARAKVPEHVRFQTKGALALAEVDRLRATGVRFGAVAADAGYGTSAAFRAALTRRGLLWAVGVLGTQRVYPTTVTLRPPRRRRGPRGGRPGRHPVPSAPAVAAAALIDGPSPPAGGGGGGGRGRGRAGARGGWADDHGGRPLARRGGVARVRASRRRRAEVLPGESAGDHLAGRAGPAAQGALGL